MPPVNLTTVEGVSLDALTIGNALVDVLATVDEGFLVREKIVKGSMNLVDIQRSKHLHSLVHSRTEMSGGSAANTAYGLASLGGKAGFIGKISADRLGDAFSRDLEMVGVKFFPGATCATEDTGRCLIVVTPDGNRTMNTFLGAASLLDAADISKTAVQNAAVVLLEGYLFDKDAAKDAFRTAAEYAHAAGRKVALTLSDSFCVDRHRDDFLSLVKNDCSHCGLRARNVAKHPSVTPTRVQTDLQKPRVKFCANGGDTHITTQSQVHASANCRAVYCRDRWQRCARNA